jgi:hypothetical protein
MKNEASYFLAGKINPLYSSVYAPVKVNPRLPQAGDLD